MAPACCACTARPIWAAPALCPGQGATGAPLGPGPVVLETWGDHAEPYLALGFEVAEEIPGRELDPRG